MLNNNILILFILILLFLTFWYPLLNESFNIENNSSIESSMESSIERMCANIVPDICSSSLCPSECKPKRIDTNTDTINAKCNCVIRLD
jgi:hypothetical protein